MRNDSFWDRESTTNSDWPLTPAKIEPSGAVSQQLTKSTWPHQLQLEKILGGYSINIYVKVKVEESVYFVSSNLPHVTNILKPPKNKRCALKDQGKSQAMDLLIVLSKPESLHSK